MLTTTINYKNYTLPQQTEIAGTFFVPPNGFAPMEMTHSLEHHLRDEKRELLLLS